MLGQPSFEVVYERFEARRTRTEMIIPFKMSFKGYERFIVHDSLHLLRITLRFDRAVEKACSVSLALPPLCFILN